MNIDLLVDLVRAPFIYRRVVAQVPVSAADIEPVLDAVLTAFAPVRTREARTAIV